jgi:integrase/recombinase XerC
MCLKVKGKRNKERIIPLGNHIIELLTLFIKEFRTKMVVVNQNNFIFVTKDGEPIYPRLVNRIVRKYLGLVSSRQKRSPHVLRHTFATHMLDNGADLNAIKEILGHSSLAATQVYTHNTIDRLKSIYKQAHPKA